MELERKTTQEFCSDRVNIICPFCGFEYVHFEKFVFKTGDITITFYGECGHRWNERQYEYEGNLFTEIDRLSDVEVN